MDEYKKWIEQSEKDLDTAKYNLEGKKIEAGIFFLQQSAEKALKALHIKKYKELLKVHDLVLLAKKLSAPEDIRIKCSKINPSYIDTRYPDVPKAYSEVDTIEIVKLAEEVISWIEKNL